LLPCDPRLGSLEAVPQLRGGRAQPGADYQFRGDSLLGLLLVQHGADPPTPHLG